MNLRAWKNKWQAVTITKQQLYLKKEFEQAIKNGTAQKKKKKTKKTSQFLSNFGQKTWHSLMPKLCTTKGNVEIFRRKLYNLPLQI